VNIIDLQNKTTYFSIVLLLAFLYYTTGAISLDVFSGHKIVNVGVFASEGFALAFILFFGRSVWPGIFLGQFLLAYSNDIGALASAEIAAINSFEALIALRIFQTLKFDLGFTHFKDLTLFISVVALILQPFSSSMAHIVLYSHTLVGADELGFSIFSWWFGNVMGQLLITPFVLLFLQNYKNINLLEYILYPFGFALFLYILEIHFAITNVLLLLSISLSVLVLIVSQKGMLYGSAINVLIAMTISYAVYNNLGIFHLKSTLDNIINYNLFVLAHILASFIVGIRLEEKKRSEDELKKIIAQEIEKNQNQQLLLIQQSRLAQMGEMISMIAHQWRQPLNALTLSNQLLVAKYTKGKLDTESMEYFKNTSKELITQMSQTIDDFKNFFTPKQEEELFCINDVVESILNIVADIYEKDGVEISFHAQESLYTLGYPSELGQAILNITNNARDALNETNPSSKQIILNLKKDTKMIILSIQDTGGGIDEAIQEKIFDPYFSTKTQKNGTGLGLYMTQMIINKQGARLELTNTNNGALFQIYLKEKKI